MPESMLGQYRITSKLGEGGMGAVYRATDTRLNREVAIKVLPDAFAADPERMARFNREAQVLAALNHHNIAQVYGIEERAIVMELVDGRNLAGPLPLDTALDYARQIALALEAAHEKGITHRDLKPANIKVTPEGQIKVLDFGLAKANSAAAAAGAENSPTLALTATQAGVILGTAAYMAPEQAKGKAVDRRTDIWAFGVVLYEMLTGRQLYTGDNASEVLAAVILKDPDLSSIPLAVRGVVERCLRKDPARRWQWIADARIALEEAPAEFAPTLAAPLARGRMWPWASAVLMAALGAFVAWMLKPTPDAPLMQMEINPPDGVHLGFPTYGQSAVAPDGQSVVFVGRGSDGKIKLWLRPFNSETAIALDGTEGASNPSWSLDLRYISFVAGGALKVRDQSSGAVRTLGFTRGSNIWGADGSIVAVTTEGLMKIRPGGGEPTRVVRPVPGETRQATPAYLPDGRRLLYISVDDGLALRVAHPDGSVGPRFRSPTPAMVVLDGAGKAWLFASTALTLQARPFDLSKEQPYGEPVTIVSDVPAGPAWTISRNGVLVYRHAQRQTHTLRWVNRDGSRGPSVADTVERGTLQISPDGRTAAFPRIYGADQSIWVLDIPTGSVRRFSFGHDDWGPVWSPDGRSLYYASRKGEHDYFIIERAADGSGVERNIWKDTRAFIPVAAPRNGTHLLVTASAGGVSQFHAVPLSGGAPVRLTNEGISSVVVSPDGRWIAYAGSVQFTAEIFVKPLPKDAGGPGGAEVVQVSQTTGNQPLWSADGKEILFLSSEGKMMSAAVEPGAIPRFAAPVPLFDRPREGIGPNPPRGYDVTPDGKRFLVREDTPAGEEPPLSVVFNWWKLMK